MKRRNKPTKCRLCDGKCDLKFTERVLKKYKVDYFVCQRCGLLQTEKPHWLKEAYSSAIVDADTGLLSRNNILSKITSSILFFLYNKNYKLLDYAGGYGVFTRLMRDKGFDAYWADPMAENIFAIGFEENKKDKYQMVTSFEFLEHLEKPLEELKTIVKRYDPDSMLFSTTLYTDPIDENWWYFTYETGQHIAFYTQNTLEYLAKELGYSFCTNGVHIHLFSKQKIPSWKFTLITKFWFVTDLWVMLKMKSKTFDDHLKLLGKEK